MSDAAVSVICITYNHAPYIKRCLDGFVMQETSFPFEIIVHDDASTDGTADIIRAYAEKYPDIIKPILQKENQYSQGNRIRDIMRPFVSGKYIALCEGDDYWIDSQKLQLQYDYMEANPDCAICVHNTIVHNVANGTDRLIKDVYSDRDYSPEEIIEHGGGIFCTSSVFIRKEPYYSIPTFFRCPGVGDFQNYLYASICGKCHYMPRIMSVYNYGIPGSWTARVTTETEKREAHLRQFEEMLENVNSHYDGRFTDILNRRRRKSEFWKAVENQNYGLMTSKEYRDIYEELLPGNYEWFQFIKDRWKKRWKSRLFSKIIGADNYAKLKKMLGR